jgi:hypothetical protein
MPVLQVTRRVKIEGSCFEAISGKSFREILSQRANWGLVE